MLAGEILYRDGEIDEGIAKLREAVRAEDALPYSEPPDWILPARHSLGAALMQERHRAEIPTNQLCFPAERILHGRARCAVYCPFRRT
jgi:hypothetical protein